MNWRWRRSRWSSDGRMTSTAMRLGGALILIGGILMIVFGLIGSVGSAFSGLFRGAPMAYAFQSGLLAGMGLIVDLVGGIIAIFGSRRAYSLIWGIVLLIVGVVVGGWGGLLVIIGAVIALVASHV